MFTGIVEELGIVERTDRRGDGARLKIQCRKALEDSHEGSSIAVNGVCLTAIDLTASSFVADLAPETMRRTNLGDLRPGSAVNLERPLSPAGRLSGHIVQGHIDGTGVLLALEELGDNNWWLEVRIPPELDRYLVYKGSIAIDGVSLTVAELRGEVAAITVIPHTYLNTTLGARKPGERVNIECDMLAKHVEKLLGKMEVAGGKAGLTIEGLKEQGY